MRAHMSTDIGIGTRALPSIRKQLYFCETIMYAAMVTLNLFWELWARGVEIREYIEAGLGAYQSWFYDARCAGAAIRVGQ